MFARSYRECAVIGRSDRVSAVGAVAVFERPVTVRTERIGRHVEPILTAAVVRDHVTVRIAWTAHRSVLAIVAGIVVRVITHRQFRPLSSMFSALTNSSRRSSTS